MDRCRADQMFLVLALAVVGKKTFFFPPLVSGGRTIVFILSLKALKRALHIGSLYLVVIIRHIWHLLIHSCAYQADLGFRKIKQFFKIEVKQQERLINTLAHVPAHHTTTFYEHRSAPVDPKEHRAQQVARSTSLE